MAKHTGFCRICGAYGPLTFEHVPPLAAGNEQMGRALDVAQYLQTNPSAPLSAMRVKKLPKGSGGYFLCKRCNNDTGAWYVREYASWAYQGEALRQSLGSTNSIALPFNGIPARVIKQILAIFAATCGEGLFEANPFLRKLVLDRDARGFPSDVRVYCYIVDRESKHSRQSGITGMISGTDTHTFAEFAYRPFGYIMTLDGKPPPDPKLFDITFFSHGGFNDYRELHLPLPVRPVVSYFPADFRNKTEWDEAVKAAAKD